MKPVFNWGIAAQFLWIAACMTTLFSVSMKSAWADQAWYWAAVLSCCPLIAVLGAKRPTNRVWTWFIVLPLIAVLGWPAVTALVQFPAIVPLRTQLPVLIGFVLVLVMGAGNYAGSRYGGSALAVSIAVLLSLWPISNLFSGDQEIVNLFRGMAAMLCALGIQYGFHQASRPTLDESRFDRLWFDFRDAFGIVWSIRIQDRINQTAEAENWNVRIGTEGFVWETGISEADRLKTEDRLIHTLRWLLRRFVDPEWIDERLGTDHISKSG